MLPAQTTSDERLPACYQPLKILIFQHLLGQLLLCLVPPWRQVCPAGSTFCTLELLFWLRLCHTKATKMPKTVTETPFNTSSGHQWVQQTFPWAITNFRLSFETDYTGPHVFVHRKLAGGNRQLYNWARKQKCNVKITSKFWTIIA